MIFQENMSAHSKQVKLEADEFIDFFNIYKISEIGKIHFSGAYFLDLMFARDIDIIVLVDRLDLKQIEKGLEFLLKHSNISESNFKDRVKGEAAKNRRYYFYLSFRWKKEDWNLDIAFWHKRSWIPNQTRDLYKRLNDIRKQLTSEKKKSILQIKYELTHTYFERNKDEITSNMIYDAVLNYSVEQTKDLLKHYNL